MAGFDPFSGPGITTKSESVEWDGFLQAFSGEQLRLETLVTIDSTATDAGASPTTTLRAGLILGVKASDGNAYAYDADATDGTQIPLYVLPYGVNMLSPAGVATDRQVSVLTRANLKVAKLVNSDAFALSALSALGFVFDTPAGAQANADYTGVRSVATDTTVTAAMNGSLFIATAAANFTLPTKAVGLSYEFLMTADANMVVTGSSDIVVKGGATRSTVTFSTSSEKIGSRLRVECIYIGGALKWVVSNLGDTTMTLA